MLELGILDTISIAVLIALFISFIISFIAFFSEVPRQLRRIANSLEKLTNDNKGDNE